MKLTQIVQVFLVFLIRVLDSIPVQVDNGKEVITVKAFVLGEHKDEEPARNNKK